MYADRRSPVGGLLHPINFYTGRFPLDLENPFGAIGEVFWKKSARMGIGQRDSLFCCFRHICAHTVRVWLPNNSHTGVSHE